MTAIAFRPPFLVTDGKSSIGKGLAMKGRCVKAWRHPEGKFIVAGAGDAAVTDSFIEWCKLNDPTEGIEEAPVIDDDSEINIYFPNGEAWNAHKGHISVSYDVEFDAFGVAKEYLMGLMEAGLPAEAAVFKAALNFDGCGFPITVLRFDRPDIVTIEIESIKVKETVVVPTGHK